jgi:hypothetical protein
MNWQDEFDRRQWNVLKAEKEERIYCPGEIIKIKFQLTSVLCS